MADLNSIQAAGTTKIVGSDINGVETNPVSAPTSTPSLSDPGLVTRSLPYEPQTYSAGASNFAIATTPTDIWNITGSATKTIKIKRIRVTGTTTSGSPISVSMTLVKRSTANTGGTRVASIVVAHDSTNSAGTASVGHYTANPTALGTLVGNIRAHRATFNQSGITGGDIVWDFGDINNQPIVLRGVAEQISINFNATSITGSNISISVTWEEV